MVDIVPVYIRRYVVVVVGGKVKPRLEQVKFIVVGEALSWELLSQSNSLSRTSY